MDVIVTNPPFGGEEEKGIQGNFSEDRQTAETALLFLQLIMRKLRREPSQNGQVARAAVVVPNGLLSAPGVARRLRMDLLNDFDIKAIVRLPHNVFAPYTDIKTNIIFFERNGPTMEIFYCEPELPDGYALSKTKPLPYEVLRPLEDLVKTRRETALSWLVSRGQIGETVNLDIKNPRLQLTDLSKSGNIDILARHFRDLAAEAEAVRAEMASAIEAVKTARLRPLNQVTVESDERIAKTYSIQTKLLGVSAEDGICEPKTAIGKNPERYKILKTGYLAYNPMRINIGSIGFIRKDDPGGITSPDYVVFYCKAGLSVLSQKFLVITNGA